MLWLTTTVIPSPGFDDALGPCWAPPDVVGRKVRVPHVEHSRLAAHHDRSGPVPDKYQQGAHQPKYSQAEICLRRCGESQHPSVRNPTRFSRVRRSIPPDPGLAYRNPALYETFITSRYVKLRRGGDILDNCCYGTPSGESIAVETSSGSISNRSSIAR